MGKTLGYARISTSQGQDAASQKTMLESLGAVVVFVDIGNGSKLTGRDQLEAALRLLDEGDTLLALHPDRLARDTGDLLTIAKRVIEKKAVLRINDPAITLDGTDIMAEVMLTVFGLVGMMEKHSSRRGSAGGSRRRSSGAMSTRAVLRRSARTLCAIFANRGLVPPRSPSVSRSGGRRSTGCSPPDTGCVATRSPHRTTSPSPAEPPPARSSRGNPGRVLRPGKSGTARPSHHRCTVRHARP